MKINKKLLPLLVLIIAVPMLRIHRNYPNVILITIDALRPDHLGCYGYERSTSPNIDNFAKEGVIFTQAIAQATYTLASVPSFITSVCPYMHLIDYKEKYAYLNPEIKTLLNILKEKGFLTGLFTDHPDGVGRLKGLKNNLDNYVELDTRSPEKLTKLCLQWCKKSKNKRLFLWLYYFGPHGPYGSSAYCDTFYKDGLSKKNQKNVRIATDDKKELFGIIPRYTCEGNITDVDYYIARYDGNIRVIDDQVGVLLKEIKKIGLDKNTLIILMSDHGESLGEHNLYFAHGRTLYDELLKVPLIIRYPKLIPRNKLINNQVQLMDIVPTIVDILHINKNISDMSGISLLTYLLRENNYNDNKRLIFSNSGGLYSIRTEDWKLIFTDKDEIKKIPESSRYGDWYSNEYELYNIKCDPAELHNLVGVEKERFGSLKKVLKEYIIKANQLSAKTNNLIRKYYKAIPLREMDKERLQSLGYAQ